MSSQAIAESHGARRLLELATAGADCRVGVGGRTVLLSHGAVAEVQGAAEDISLLEFLAAAGRLSESERDEIARQTGGHEPLIDRALSVLPELTPNLLLETRRALFLERLVRGLAKEDEEGTRGPISAPLENTHGSPTFDTVALVLDALARRAAHGEAEVVGALHAAKLIWLEASGRERATLWADLGEAPSGVSVGTLFPRHPAAPSRIAALVRAGVARLEIEPKQRASTAAQVGQTPTPSAPTGGPLGIVPVAPWIPKVRGPLGDPLAPLEARLEALGPLGDAEHRHARAEIWLALAELHRARQHSLPEATRAAREAAAAAPDDERALALAAELSGASGAPELAYAYARSLSERARAPEAKAQALKRSAVYATRAGLIEAALKALEGACEITPEDWALHAQLARALAQRGDVQAAVERAHSAATRARSSDPEQACTILEWAAKLVPSNLRTWDDLGKSILRHGRPRAASAMLAHAARKQHDPAVRARLRLTAIAIADHAGNGDLASELLIEAIDGGNFLPEPLAKHLEGSAKLELAVIAQELATRVDREQRGRLLVCAARAYEQLDGVRDAAFELLCSALVVDPQRAYEPLIALARDPERQALVRDALERAVRVRCPDREAARALDGETRVQVIWLVERLRDELTDIQGAPLDTFLTELLGALDGRVPTAAEAQLLSQRSQAYAARAEQLEAALRAAPASARAEPARALADLLRCDPARRAAARKLYEKVLEKEDEPEAFGALLRLLWLMAEDATACDLLARRAAASGSAGDHLAHAYAALRLGELARARDACSAALLSEDAVHDEALVLAWRLAHAARDAAQVDAALRALVAAAPDPETRARRLLRHARALRENGKGDEALRSVDEALACDPASAEAALWISDEATAIPPGPRIVALRRARNAIGESPELLRQIARACFAVNDPRGQREALEALLALSPEDGFAARALVALLSTGNDVAALSAALRLALSPARFTPAALPVAEAGLARLAKISDAARAVEIVLAAIEQLGEQARPLLRWARGIAHELSNPALRIQIVEHAIAHAAPEEQPELLRGLAAQWRERDVGWAEARAQLRLLALSPDEPHALERLLAIYAASGEAKRLEAVLALSSELAATEPTRRERLFERAQCAAQLQNDRALAATLISQALTANREAGEPQGVPIDVLRRGIGLLAVLDPERAIVQLLELAESATPERSRDLIEEALVLAERQLELPALALRAATEGTLRHPDHEPFVRALERLARATGALEQLASTLESAADRCRDPERQAALFTRAATIGETELHDLERACLALDQAYRATPTRAIEEQLLGAASRLFAKDARAGKLAYDRLRDALHVRAKFGPPLSRAGALVTLARLSIEVYLRAEEGERYAQAAETILAAAHDVPRELRNDLRDELDALQSQLSRESMRVTLPSARNSLIVGMDEGLMGRHSAPTMRPTRGSVPAVTMRPLEPGASALQSLAPIEIRAQAATAVTMIPEASPVERSDESTVLSRASLHEAADLVAAVVRGDSAALLALTEQLGRDRDSAPRVCSRLLSEARTRGFSVCALRGLRIASAGANAHALWRTSSQALAFFDPPLRPPPHTRRRDTQGQRALVGLKAARATAFGPALSLLAQLVEAAAPLFRNARTKQARALTPLRDAPYGQLLAELAQLFEARLEAYPASSGEDRVSLFSAQPASLSIGSRTPKDSAALRFRLSRAFEYARPENLLLVTLSGAQAETLFAAVRAAFAPADAQREQVSREAAALAAELWRTMPSAAQRNVARLLAQLPGPLDHAMLARDAQLRGARVALFMTRELDVALHQLGLDGDPDSARIGVSEGELDRAMRAEPLVRDLFAYAFDDAYLESVLDPGN